MRSIAGLILAGGMSTRMNQDKALLEINGENLLGLQHRVLNQILDSRNIYVSGSRAGYQFIEDHEYGLGPLEGLRSACDFFIRNTDYQSLILLPVDMPFLDAETLNHLLYSVNEDVDLIHYQNYQLPIFFNDIRKLFTTIELLKMSCQIKQEISNKDKKKFSFKELFNVLKCFELEVINHNVFKNINTPEDFYAAISTANIVKTNR